MVLVFYFVLSVIVVPGAMAHAEAHDEFRPTKMTYAKASGTAVNPSPDPSVDSIMDFDDFLKLSKTNQQYYLMGLQKLMLDISKQDAGFDFEEIARISNPLLNWLLPDAEATDAALCVYAGNLSHLDSSGHYCVAPSGSCHIHGQVQCNPMLYGAGKCVPRGRAATQTCERNKESPAQIAAEIRASGAHGRQAWSHLRSQLGSYCSSPRPTQQSICGAIRAQMVRLDRVIGRTPAAQQAASPSATPDVASVVGPTVAPTVAPAAAAANADAPAAVDTASRRPTTSSKALKVLNEAAPRTDVAPHTDVVRHQSTTSQTRGVCNPAALLADLRAESNAQSSSVNLMSIDSAQTLMCSQDEIPPEWVEGRRALIASRVRALGGSGHYQNADRLSYEGVLDNFNTCLQNAQALRRSGGSAISGHMFTLQRFGPNWLRFFDESGRVISDGSVQSYLEGNLRRVGMSLCNIRIIDGAGTAPAMASPSHAVK